MSTTIFFGTAKIHIQGTQVLKFISLDDKQAQFDIVGLSVPRIRVIDRRPYVMSMLKEIIITQKGDKLTDCFNQPAHITILSPDLNPNEVTVQLRKTHIKNPRHMLWIAVGIRGAIPYYDYKKLEIRPFRNKTFALFSLYKCPVSRKE